jgi:hypothetical protein
LTRCVKHTSKQRVRVRILPGAPGQRVFEVLASVAGSQKGATRSMAEGGGMVAPMTQASLSKRQGQGEDSIYWDASKNRYVGAVSLGFSLSGARIRKKVTGWTKTEVRDKLRELHRQVAGGLRPRRRYTGGGLCGACRPHPLLAGLWSAWCGESP